MKGKEEMDEMLLYRNFCSEHTQTEQPKGYKLDLYLYLLFITLRIHCQRRVHLPKASPFPNEAFRVTGKTTDPKKSPQTAQFLYQELRNSPLTTICWGWFSIPFIILIFIFIFFFCHFLSPCQFSDSQF